MEMITTIKHTKKVKMPFRIFICTMLLSVLFTSCAEWDADGVDFRNYLRDKHPYSKLDEVDLNTWKSYVVNDTINNEVWIYTSGRSEISVRGIRINYYISNLKEGEQ